MNKKGQAALEFLTTYGWAFLVILVMIGALAYFGVLNPQKILPNKCTVQTGITCGRYIVNEGTQAFTIELTNNLPDHAYIHTNGFEYYDPSAGTYTACAAQTATGAGLPFDLTGGGLQWNRGQQLTFVCTTANLGIIAGDKTKVEFRIHYNPGTVIDPTFATYMNGDILVEAAA